MASFRDANGKDWTVSLDAPTIRTVRSECKIDLVGGDGQAYAQMSDDPVLLVDVLWVICRKQCQAAGVSDEHFGAALVGQAIERATKAMLEAILDFSPSDRKELLKASVEKNARLRSLGMERALAKINDPELETRVIAAMEARMDEEIRGLLQMLTPAKSATNSPDIAE